METRTLADLFLVVAQRSKPDQLQSKRDGRYEPISSEELSHRVFSIAEALRRHGVKRGDRVALMAENGPHWPAVDFAAQLLGAALVPIYPTLMPEQARYILGDCGARKVFVHTREQLDGLRSLGGVELFVLIEGEAPDEGQVTHLDAFTARGEGYDREQLAALAAEVEPGDLASLVYTSGTTGKPKGAMLSHDNFMSNINTCLEGLGFAEHHVALSFLPLSHVFERMIDYGYFKAGCSIAYAESPRTVAENMREVRPHVFVSVPRVYEKVMAKVLESRDASPPVKRRIFDWALGVGKRALPHLLRDERPGGLLGLQLALADRLVFGKVRQSLGGRFEFSFSGGAPLAPDIAEFFWSIGVRVFEGYGLTETSPVISFNRPGHVKIGTVGQPIRDCEVRIADDGEILVRGPNVMQGYYNLPEETAQAIDADGWFHTGDIGVLDEDGYLAITDRKKELIVNAYGKNIAPAPIENLLKSSRYVNQAVVIGDRRKFLSALIVPDFEALGPWAKKRGIAATEPTGLVTEPQVEALFAEEIERVNQELAHFEEIQRWALLEHELTQENGELTPTQKLKRRVVDQRYAEVIEGIYRNAEHAERSDS